MCLMSSLIFITPSTLTPFQGQAMQISEKQVDNNEMVQMQDLRLKNFMEQVEKDRIELEKKKAEEEVKKQKQLEEQKKNIKESHKQVFILTYYGLLESECGKIDGITASGKRITDGMIASPPQLKFGTKIIIEGKEYVVEDRGSSKYIKINNDGSIRIDVYLPKLNNETDKDYLNRIENKGVKRVQGYIIK